MKILDKKENRGEGELLQRETKWENVLWNKYWLN